MVKEKGGNPYVNLKIYSDDNLTLEEDIANFTYERNQYLTFNDEYGQHKLDFQSKVYEKNHDDVIFSVDFVNNLGIIILNSNQRFEFAVESFLDIKEKAITLKYKLDQEEIKIEILLKE